MSGMTIAQALRRVNKLKGLIKEHKESAQACSSYEEEKAPEFDFHEEVREMNALTNEMVNLKAKISAANAANSVSDGTRDMTLAVAVLALVEMKGAIAFYKGLNLHSGLDKIRDQEWDDNADKYITRVIEKNWIAAMTEKERLAKIRELEDRFEVLNNAVEDANHKVLV